MKKEKYMSWDTYFMSIAILSSFRSKEPKFPNGACIINSDKKIVGTGYAGLPSGCDDNDPKFWGGDDDDSKEVNPRHAYIIHAELNAILNSKVDLTGSTIYCTQYPCNKCTQTICQAGIKKVVYMVKKDNHKNINKYCEDMFESCNVEEVAYESLDVDDKRFIESLIEINKKFY